MSSKAQTWHPCMQMKELSQFPPFRVKKSYGPYIELEDGRRLIDGISSWWCKSLGHNEPRIKAAVNAQMECFEHVMFANNTFEQAERLTKKLSQLSPGLDKVFYAGDGASAIEIALKMSVMSRQIKGESERTQFICLKEGYHGDTSGAMSVSDCGQFNAPFQPLMFESYKIQNIPYVTGEGDPLWDDCSEIWQHTEKELELFKETGNALILEPLAQGAGGINIYSQDFLKQLSKWCKVNNVYLIADEIMTGIGRTGKMLACDHADIQPDFLCLSKGLTSGWLPMSIVLTHDQIYQCFYDEFASGKSFLHSHTYSGNALGVAAALATLGIFESDQIVHYVSKTLAPYMKQAFHRVAKETDKLANIRSLGAIVAGEMTIECQQRLSPVVTQKAGELGALLRPIGNTLYWMPPLNCELSVIDELATITIQSLLTSYQ